MDPKKSMNEEKRNELRDGENLSLRRFAKGRAAKWARAFVLMSTIASSVAMAPDHAIAVGNDRSQSPTSISTSSSAPRQGSFFESLLSPAERERYRERVARQIANAEATANPSFKVPRMGDFGGTAGTTYQEQDPKGSSPKNTQRSSGASHSLGSFNVDDLGSLSARFESGGAGPAVIGYDGTGGTSYGTYQLSSKTGSFSNFVDYLEDKNPDWARALRSAGPANTGGTSGGAPAAWKKIAAEQPKAFAAVQHGFIRDTYYKPALSEINKRTGMDLSRSSATMQQVIWSTAVQHGPRGAANVFAQAESIAQHQGGPAPSDQALAMMVYEVRKAKFGSSSESVRKSVQRRLEEERGMVRVAMGEETGRGLGR